MNRALILLLLLVILVQSRGYGAVLPGLNSNDRIQDSQLEGWDGTDSTYPADDLNSDPFRKRSFTSDALTRRSALDKNFMRFGRGGGAFLKQCGREREDGKRSFYRFGRGLKDGFIRFGRGGGKDGFIRFGRTRPEDFFRAGKSLRENFIRFGKADKNFMRFGRENTDTGYQNFFSSEELFQRLGRPSRNQDNFLRFGKSGKNGTNFLRFGKSEYAESDGAAESDQNSNAAKGEKRKRRDVQEKLSSRSFKSGSERGTEYFEIPADDFPRRISPTGDSSWQKLENLRNSRLTPFFPVYSNHPKSVGFFELDPLRNAEGRNFVKFG